MRPPPLLVSTASWFILQVAAALLVLAVFLQAVNG
jgi:hypothetical protein